MKKRIHWHQPSTRLLVLAIVIAVAAVSLATRGALATPKNGLDVLSVSHRGHKSSDTMVWQTRFGMGVSPDHPIRIPLAYPLPGDTPIGCNLGEVHKELNDRGEIEAIQIVDDRNTVQLRRYRTYLDVELTTEQAMSEAMKKLRPPVPDTAVPQRMIISGGEAFDFRVAPQLGYERRIGFTVHPSVDRARRRVLNHELSSLGETTTGHPIYFIADANMRAAGGLPGELSPMADKQARAGLFLLGFFGVLVAGLVALMRRMAKNAQYEEAEAFIDREYEDLDLGPA